MARAYLHSDFFDGVVSVEADPELAVDVDGADPEEARGVPWRGVGKVGEGGHFFLLLHIDVPFLNVAIWA